MPVLGAGGKLITLIKDLVDCAVYKLENRVTDRIRIAEYVRDAILELASNGDFRDEFVELEVLGPTVNLTPSIQEYDEGIFLPTTSTVNDATLDMMLFFDPPFNTKRRKLRYIDYQESDMFVTSPVAVGQPTMFYRFGGSLGFYLVPDKAYQVQSRFLKQHLFNENALEATPVLLPRDFNEVVCWAAVQRGFMGLEEFEKASAIHQMLYGDPKRPDKPGLINSRKKKRERERWREESRLSPVVRRYSY